MQKFVLEAPWETWCKELKALFEEDEDISVSDVYTPENGMDADYVVAVQVRKHEKFLALDRLLPRVKCFGNVTLGIDLYDEENAEVNVGALFATLFEGNPKFDAVRVRTDPTNTDWVYVMFQPKVIQFHDDDISDYNGNWTGLAEEIARDVFAENGRGVFFCTSPVNGENRPLGEWP